MEEANEMEKLPEGWKRVRLGDNTYFKVVGSGIDYFRGYKNYLSTNSVQGKKITHIEEIITFKNRPSRANMQPKKDRVAFAKMRNTIKVLLIDEKLEKDYILSTGFAIIETVINPKFIYQYLLSPFFNKQKDIFAEGTTQEAISNDDFDKIYITFPELNPEQQKIAEILETVDNVIEKTDRIIEKYKRIKQGLMQDLLTKGIDEKGNIRSEKTHKFKDSPLGRIPKEWEVVRLGEVSKIKRGASPRPIDNPIYFTEEKKGRGWIRIEDIAKSNKYLNATRQYLSKLGESKSVKVEVGDLIMSICATIGKPIIVNMPACIHDGFVVLKNLSCKIDKHFLYYLIVSKEQEIEKLGQTGTQGNLNSTIVSNFLIPLPPLPEQQRIAEILSQIDKTIEKEEQYKEKLERLKQGLMEDLLTGKVRVNHLIKEGVENV
jgi:type I restriction enzyme S subunit